VRGDVAELDVSVLGGGAEDVEGLVGGAPVLGHDDAQGLVDDGAGGERGAQVFTGYGLRDELLVVAVRRRRALGGVPGCPLKIGERRSRCDGSR
jgi:hypothetical protein